MQDQRGLYYHPFPANPKTRMYVRRQGGEIHFRLWNADDPELWEKHGWVPLGAVRAASAIYKGGGPFDPKVAYDQRVAEALLREAGQ
jgi:hypothetical protein